MNPRQAHFNLFLYGAGHHQAAWRAEDSPAEELTGMPYYISLAQLAEKGLFDAVFLADGQTLSAQAADGPGWMFEPMTLLTALSQHTKAIGLVCTVSSSLSNPFQVARSAASLDRISGGRFGINVVTSMWDAEAQNHSQPTLGDHMTRYAKAEEFIRVLKQLFASYPDTALLARREAQFTDLEQTRRIDHFGEYFSVRGPLSVPVLDSGRPVLFQAGASKEGRELAAAHADAIYAVAADHSAAMDYADDLRQRVQRRDPTSNGPLIMPGLVTYVGRTYEEARAKQRRLNNLLPIEQSLAQLESFIQQDPRAWDLDEPVPALPPLEEFSGPAGRYATILRLIDIHQPTVRELLGMLAAGGGHCTMIGTPDMIADEIELWLDCGAADGFNLMPPALPDGLQDFIDLVIPELQRRGRFRIDYAHRTLRGHLGLPDPRSAGMEVAQAQH